MHFAFAIASLFASGGLQRDCLKLAGMVQDRGHRVTILTADLRERVETQVPVIEVATRGVTNPARDRQLGEHVEAHRDRFSRVVGFNKMLGLDVLYCADPPYAAMKTNVHRLRPRLRAQLALESVCFAEVAGPSLILLSDAQADAYVATWNTPRDRIAVLPPTLDAGRRRPFLRDDGQVRDSIRAQLGVPSAAPLWLSVAAVPLTKGVDRAVAALTRRPGAVLAVAGTAPHSRGGRHLRRLARTLGVAERVRLLGHREDIAELMAAADLLVHPARRDTTGSVILEAIANGLPAIVSGACGYADHVRWAGAGLVCPEPFDAEALASALATAHSPERLRAWSQAGRAYGADPVLSSGHDRALELVTGPLWGGSRPDRARTGRTVA